MLAAFSQGHGALGRTGARYPRNWNNDGVSKIQLKRWERRVALKEIEGLIAQLDSFE